MTYRYMKNEKALPVWAALGAPLVGVPLMVGLLAIVSPKADAPAQDASPALMAEPVETHAVEPLSLDSALRPEEATAGAR